VLQFDPLKHYFETLPKWNPQTDQDHILKLSSYLPVKDKARFEIQFKKWLVRAVACSIKNVVNKQALILVHDQQNSGKTTFLRNLCPPILSEYIAENITTDKDSLIAMCTNFLINQDELSTMNKAEINALKAVMSKDRFKGRLPYAARETNLIRRANIIGSTNKMEFLSDETDSVRFLCFELTGKINFDYKDDVDINLVWAQAYSLLISGFKYELTPEEITENENANADYRITTAEQELIQSYFLPCKKDDLGSMFKTSTDIKILLQEKHPSERLNTTTVGKALTVLGHVKCSVRPNGIDNPIKGYYVAWKPSPLQ
jgi:predicted P-loop ATPase